MNRITATQGVVIFLFVVVVYGALHMLASANPESRLSKAWLQGLGF